MSYCIRRYAKNLLRLSRSREVKKGVHFFRQSNCGRESQANSISTQVTGLAQPMHIPVMQKEVLELLAPSKGNVCCKLAWKKMCRIPQVLKERLINKTVHACWTELWSGQCCEPIYIYIYVCVYNTGASLFVQCCFTPTETVWTVLDVRHHGT